MTMSVFVNAAMSTLALELFETKSDIASKYISRFKRDDLNTALARTILQLAGVAAAVLLTFLMPTMQAASWAVASAVLQLIVAGESWSRLILIDDGREPSILRRFVCFGIQSLSVFAACIGLMLAIVHVLTTL